MWRLAFALVVAAGLGQSGFAQPPATPAVEQRILFIGNSLTAANNLPAMVESLALAAGNAATTRTVAFADYSLEHHWQRGDAKREIAKGGWSLVDHVVQPGGHRPKLFTASIAVSC